MPEVSLEAVIKEHEQIRRELAEVKKRAEQADHNADRAHKRINTLEVRLDDIGERLSEMSRNLYTHGERINNFDKKQDTFLSNTWSLIKYLLILLAMIVTILGGLVGIKLSFPF